MEGLNPFDKINLAACAVARAKLHLSDSQRFKGEYDTALLWKGHRVTQFSGDLGCHSFISKA